MTTFDWLMLVSSPPLVQPAAETPAFEQLSARVDAIGGRLDRIEERLAELIARMP